MTYRVHAALPGTALLGVALAQPAAAESLKIGVILSYSGPR